MKKILYMLFAATCIIACDSNDDYTQEVFTSDAFDGEWLLCDENDPKSATEVTFISRGFSYRSSTYVNLNKKPELYEKYNGHFVYIKATNSIRLSALAEISSKQCIYDFKVESVKPFTMVLINKEFNSYDEYYRIIKKINIKYGNIIDNSYLTECGFSADEFVSVNSNIASVDANGNITPTGTGSTYIVAKSNEQKIAVKVTVESMATTYSELVYNACLSDIINMFGEPNYTGNASDTSIGLVYENPSSDMTLKTIQFYIDLETEKVTRVLSIYDNEDRYNSDVSFIKQKFFAVEFGNIYYCDAEDFSETRVHIYPFEKDGNYYISYGSTYFFLTNWHY